MRLNWLRLVPADVDNSGRVPYLSSGPTSSGVLTGAQTNRISCFSRVCSQVIIKDHSVAAEII